MGIRNFFENLILIFLFLMRREIEKPKLLGIGDVKKILNVSPQYVDKLVNSGKLQFFNTSAGKIFREEDVLKFKKEREEKAKKDKRINIK